MFQGACDPSASHSRNLTLVWLSGENSRLEIVHGGQELARTNVRFSDNKSGLFHMDSQVIVYEHLYHSCDIA